MALFTVTNLSDNDPGSLRDFISTANGSEGADIIDFDTSLSDGTINLTSGELGISDNLTINGLGADLLTLDAGGNSRIFNVDDGDADIDLDVTIDGLTITGGSVGFVDGGGGGIRNQENLTVSGTTISGNATSGVGGGILNYGSMTVSNSTLSGNNAFFGGGIDNDGDLTVSNSTISDNLADGGGGISNNRDLTVTNSTISGNDALNGGGFFNFDDGDLTVTNSTISNNVAFYGQGPGSGGGMYNRGDLTVSNSTISNNVADESSNILNNGTGTVTSSIIPNNSFGQDISGTFTSGGNNLIGDGDGAEGFINGINGDQVGTDSNPIDPLLGELQDNGGPTLTQALLPGSPAINKGSNPLSLQFDQRGPGFSRVVGSQTDVGAVEVPEPDSTLGVLGMAVLGVVLLRKHQRRQKLKV